MAYHAASRDIIPAHSRDLIFPEAGHDSVPRFPYYCALCLFKLEIGEQIIICKFSARPETPTPLRGTMSNPMLPPNSASPWEKKLVEKTIVSEREFQYQTFSTLHACHKHCAVDGFPSDKICAVTKRDFGTARKGSLSLGSALISQITETLCHLYETPYEIAQLIAQHPVVGQKCAAAWSQIMQPSTPQVGSIVLTSDIWATFTKMQGKVYIHRLSNRQIESKNGTKCIRIYYPHDAKTLYIGQDAWGIRRLIFSATDEKIHVEEQPELWWSTLPIGELLNDVPRGDLMTIDDV